MWLGEIEDRFMDNPYCDILKIDVPDLAVVRSKQDANTFSLLIVALLERGGPMTLDAVARRFESVGISEPGCALRSLQRCRPARPPIYREGGEYCLDPHDDELGLWVFRLGLRPPRVKSLSLVRPDPEPLPGPEVPLTSEELEEAWRDRCGTWSWSSQRFVLAVLDAKGRPMTREEVEAEVGSWRSSRITESEFKNMLRRGAPVELQEDGRLWLARGVTTGVEGGADSRAAPSPALLSARRAVREAVKAARKRAERQPDAVVMRARREQAERDRERRAAEFASLRRVLLRAFPAVEPQIVVLVDVEGHAIETFGVGDLDRARARLLDFDVLGAVDVRATLHALGVDPGDRRLAELGPPQKTMRINKQGRTLKITLQMLARDSCRISRPFGDPKKLRAYLAKGEITKLRRRLEADAKSLFALYQFGRLHRGLRLTWGFLDEWLRVPWVHMDERCLVQTLREASETGRRLDVVAGGAPGWEDPWSRVRVCTARPDRRGGLRL